MVNNNKRIRALLVAVCKNSCTSDEFIEKSADEKTETVLVNKASDDKNAAEFEERSGELKKASEEILKAIKWFFETFGSDKCKDIHGAMEDDNTVEAAKNQKRPTSSRLKPTSSNTDEEAEKANKKGKAMGITTADTSMDTDSERKVKPTNADR